MDYFLGGLAVYKMVQLLVLFLPREVQPWVKVVAAVAFGYGVSYVLSSQHMAFDGLVMATIASGVHSLLRVTTLAGDLCMRRSIR